MLLLGLNALCAAVLLRGPFAVPVVSHACLVVPDTSETVGCIALQSPWQLVTGCM